MILLSSPALLLIPALIGGLTIHLLWPDRRLLAVLLKLALGTGLGLGISSIIYFVSLVIAPGRLNMLAALSILLVSLLAITLRRERAAGWPRLSPPSLSVLQWGLIGLTLIALVFSLWIFANLSMARPQGSFDAWGIWNRTARFIFRDTENWTATFSPHLFWLMHADYPLLVPLNAAWGWDVLGFETNRVPIMQSFLFLFGTVAVLFCGTAFLRTAGQGSLAALVLAGVPSLYFTGYGQISDIPLAFFILSACVLIYAGFTLGQPRLFIIAGFMAGLAAWTKNEGLIFAPACLCAVLLAGRKHGSAAGRSLLAGLAIPAAVVLYFKLHLAPPNDLLPNGAHEILAKVLDPARYWLILQAFWNQFLAFAGWPLSIFLQLILYALIVKTSIQPGARTAVCAVAIAIGLQALGYCVTYLVTPHDLQWHLDTSVGRLVMQLTPAVIFLFFSAVTAPEGAFELSSTAKSER